MDVIKHSLTYSMSAVLVTILISMGVYLGDLSTLLNLLSNVGIILFLILGLKNWRDKYRNGYISYGESMGYTSRMALFYSIVISIWTFVFDKYIGPDQLEKMKNEQIAKAIERFKEYKIPEEQWGPSLGLTKKMFEPSIQCISALVVGMIMITIINLIICAFMKKDYDGFDVPPNTAA